MGSFDLGTGTIFEHFRLDGSHPVEIGMYLLLDIALEIPFGMVAEIHLHSQVLFSSLIFTLIHTAM